jgi:quinol monooxygenase YgiN
MSAIVLLVELTLHPGRRDEYLARARRHRETVLAQEPGCRAFEIVLPDGEENEVILYEVYDDEPALEHHANTPYMNAYRDDTAPMIVERRRKKGTLGSAA